jgi:hypothetical protein
MSLSLLKDLRTKELDTVNFVAIKSQQDSELLFCNRYLTRLLMDIPILRYKF